MIFILNTFETVICKLVAANAEEQKKVLFAEHQELLEKNDSIKILRENQVISHVAHVADGGLGDTDSWKVFHDSIKIKTEELLRIAGEIAYALNKENISLIALKNAGIVAGIFQCAGCSPMGDVDLLVTRKQFRAAHEIIMKLGYTFKYRNPNEPLTLEYAEASGGAEYFKETADGRKLWVELQWRPIAGKWLNPLQEPTAEELFERAVKIRNSNLYLLSPEDNLLQVCLHTAKHSFVRAPGFRLHTDVDRIVRHQKVEWIKFIALVKRFKIKTPVYFSLKIPQEIFSTPIPISVTDTIKPSLLKYILIRSLLRKAGLFNPEKRKFSKTGYILFNALLYDTPILLLKTALPELSKIEKEFGKTTNPFRLSSFYLKYIFRLLFKRLPT